ncbi:MAG: acyltransferase [Candidatus Bathyarchaeia archaeon]
MNSLKTFNATKKNGWIIRSGTFIEPSSKIGRNLETGHNVVIRENCSLGDNVKVWSNTVIDYSCTIGNEVKIHCNCYLSQFTTIGNNVFVAPGVVMLNDVHPGCAYSRQCMRGPTIEDGAQIGGNSTILPYIRVGKGSLIGGGSVVTKSIPPNSVAYGVPAHIAGSVFNLRCKIGLNHKPYREL